MLGPPSDGVADKVPERIRWAIETLEVRPDDQLLEVGCGGGVAVALICELLREGTITAIDRSATMVTRAAARNAEHVATGRARIEVGEAADLRLQPGAFTKAFAVNVNLFWTRSPAKELATIRRLLGAAGALYLFYDAPSAAKAEALAEALLANVPGASAIEGPSPSLVGVRL